MAAVTHRIGGRSASRVFAPIGSMKSTRVSKLAHPGIAFLACSALAVLVWWMMPMDLFYRWKIPNRSEYATIATAWAASAGLFILGWVGEILFNRHRRVPISVVDDRRNARIVIWTLCLISTTAFVLLVAMVLFNNGVAGLNNPKVFREGGLGGVTTMVLLAPCTIVVWFALRLKTSRVRGVLLPVVTAAWVTLGHVYLASARLSLLLAVIACAIIYWVHRMQTRRSLPAGMIVGTACVVAVTFSFFEYFRSYQAKQNHGFETGSPLTYGMERLGMYVATAVNNGGMLYRERSKGEFAVPLFSQTAGPVGEIVYNALGVPSVYLASGGGEGALPELEANQEYNPEFNNCWGPVGPWLEGPFSAVVFFVFWGAMGSWSFRRMRAQTGVYELVIFGYVYAGVVDTSMRVASLGGSYVLLPVCAMACAVLFRRGARQRSDVPRAIAAYH